LPNAFIAELNDEGFPTYANHGFSINTLADYHIELTPNLQKALAMLSMLNVETIEAKFNSTKSRRKKSLKQLLEFEDTRKPIVKWVQQRLSDFLKILLENDLPLCLNLMRKDWIANKQILFSKTVLRPNLHFKKTGKGVHYTLRLEENGTAKNVRQQEIHILSNEPAWVILGDVLYRVAEVNGNLLKPFMTKDEVFIPRDFVKTYFQRFIVKIAAKTDITTDGFEVKTFENLTRSELRLTKDFMTNRYGFVVTFYYDKAKFAYKEPMSLKTELNFEEADVTILQYKRNENAENQLIADLENLGLTHQFGKYFELAEAENTDSELYYWLIDKQNDLRKAGFFIVPPEMEHKKLVLNRPILDLNLKQINDWFDLNGTVEIGKFKIAFQKIIPFIKNNERFFPLPDGSHFMIPYEWFEKYQPAAQLAKIENDTVRLTKAQFTLVKDLEEKVETASTNVVAENYENIVYEGSERIKATLRPYQADGVKWLINLQKNQLGGCLADDMGLGKTLQTISALQFAKDEKTVRNENENQNSPLRELGENQNDNENKNTAAAMQLSFFQELQSVTDAVPLTALIIMPASLIFNWEAELRKFAPHLMVYKHIGTKRYQSDRYLPTFDVILTTYHTAMNDVEMLQKIDFEYIVLDESQQIKNKDSKIFKALRQLKARHKLTLSGTPIENSLSDLWSQMEFINPELLGSYQFFKEEFQLPIEKNNDEIKKERLKSMTEPYILRRTKEAVAKDLPPITEQIFYAEMLPEQRKRYEKAKSQARNFLLDGSTKKQENYNMVVFSTLMRLRQLAIHPELVKDSKATNSGKFQDIMEQLDVLVKSGHKVLIFSQFVAHLNIFKRYFIARKWGFAMLTGDMKLDNRAAAVKDFEENPNTQLFLISLKAGGTGLNLTAASYVFLTDPWWNPATEKQAIARAHRIGQTKNVMVTRFITKDTIEEKILLLQQQKQQLADDIIGADDKVSFDRKELDFLLG
jgi:SNF2 family DNA or RNA helicase